MMLIKRLFSIKAQAVTELALFGTIMLVIFAALLRYAVIFNAQQQAEMFAFRKALEVSKERSQGGGFFGKSYAGANVQVQKHIYPPSVFAGQAAQDTATVGASASVQVENEAALFAASQGSDTEWLFDLTLVMKEQQPANLYYVVGPRSRLLGVGPIVENPIITVHEPGYMLALRSANDNMASNPWDAIKDMLNGRVNPENFYFVLQPVPYRDQTQRTAVAHEGTYQTRERRDSIGHTEQSATRIISETTYDGPDTWAEVGQLMLEDPDLRFLVPVSANMAITNDILFTKQRTQETPK